MRHEVDSDFFWAFNPIPPPPSPVALGEQTHPMLRGWKRTQNTADGDMPYRGLVTYELLSF